MEIVLFIVCLQSDYDTAYSLNHRRKRNIKENEKDHVTIEYSYTIVTRVISCQRVYLPTYVRSLVLGFLFLILGKNAPVSFDVVLLDP